MSGGADRAIRISTAAAVLGVAGIAAYVSYQHAFEVVRAHGESGLTARLEPATIDGLVYSSSMVVLYAARHRLPVPALARWLLALGIVATLAANVAHGWPRGPVGAVVAAWPAASLVGSYELLLWLIRTSAAAARGQSPAQSSDQAGHPFTDLRMVPIIAAGANGSESAPGGSETAGTLDGRCAVAGVDLGRIALCRGGPDQVVRTSRRRTGPRLMLRSGPGTARTKSTSRRWPPTGPAWRAGRRCRSAGSRRCSARRPAAGPGTALQRPARFLPLPHRSRRLAR